MSEPYVTNSDDITDDFGTDDAFRTWTISYLDESFSSYTAVKHSVKQVSDEDFEIIGVSQKDGIWKIPIPKVEKIEGLNDIVISVHPLRFWREKSKDLNLAASYSVVRIEDMQMLAYGVAYTGDSFTFAMTKSNWENVIQRIAKKIIENTPLEK